MTEPLQPPFHTIQWDGGLDGTLLVLDQRKLPAEVRFLPCRTVEDIMEAIRTLAVRGAPAIGIAAAFGLCIGLSQAKPDSISRALTAIEDAAARLAVSRPTAVNLFWALERMKKTAYCFVEQNPRADVQDLRRHLLKQAHTILQEDIDTCRAIGEHGESLIPDGGGILTHCNAGALATAGIGTALGILYTAHRYGKHFSVYVDETRPLLQGARLTAWELSQFGIRPTLICDNMAASLMKAGKISAVLVGADRIAANGDTANKIGTLGLSILAAHFQIPFYVAAPTSTFDLSIPSGQFIPIEHRSPDEVCSFRNLRIAPPDAEGYNPAFDVTDAERISAVITEKGILRPPLEKAIRQILGTK
ncbi:MAG TPA: S-methyl-5-thioribose-1-phosphate isomerase [Anaerohalosphaeraceae bacterium]|nr:S-methyl-5-thioribose-1-phosphate isomerase [Anaerohalosphaeraceae bacterium]